MNGEPDANVKVSTVAFADAQKVIAVGNTFTPAVSILPLNAGNQALSWTSSAPAIAAVDTTGGAVTAKSTGEAVITAVSTDGGNITASYTVKVTDGRVAVYSFEGDLKDSLQLAGQGRVTGALIGSATVGSITYGNGVIGQAAQFDGASGIRLPDGLINTNTYSVSLWLNPDQLTTYTTAFFGASSNSSWISLVPKGPSDATILWSNAVYEATAGYIIPAETWTHLTITVDNGTVKLYINGEEKFSGSGFPDIFKSSNGVFTLGVNYWDVPFKGLIDELKLYNNVLTPEAVLADYHSAGL
ncbi:LamG-like jellyroll fold domain-containing protein [Paenibacillus sp. FSL R7-0331]|uniref:LamG-like jellyroll fold domain-containing protein n=1 Tax=Paenibacillus sp. FSL R7-0331 TaxID=1536773 RepID=UPI003FA5E9D5